MKTKHAFTLIELLIVVAIIGILAAIAVPNFMNAQIKAKVTRVQSDFKAIGTAVEMYRIDHNTYPYFDEWGYAASYSPIDYRLIPLTTPLAYINSLGMVDPFLAVMPAEGYEDEEIRQSYNYRFYDAFNAKYSFNVWIVNSMGPDGTKNKGLMTELWARDIWSNEEFALYRSSNGLISAGDIPYTGGQTKYTMEY